MPDEDSGEGTGESGEQRDSEPQGPVERAEAQAERASGPQTPLGPLGPRLNRRSPFLVAMAAAAGVAVMTAVIWLVIIASGELILIGLALLLAVGIEPVVSWLTRW